MIILEAYYHSYETSTHVHSASITHFMYLQEKLVLQEKNWAVPPLEQGVRIAYDCCQAQPQPKPQL